MASFNEIDEARRLLGLGDTATLKEIKRTYRKLAHRHHPDKHGDDISVDDKQAMQRLNWAYKILTEYCSNYKYPFREEDVARTYPDDVYLRRYVYGWFDGI